jgi:hypothetical protein
MALVTTEEKEEEQKQKRRQRMIIAPSPLSPTASEVIHLVAAVTQSPLASTSTESAQRSPSRWKAKPKSL